MNAAQNRDGAAYRNSSTQRRVTVLDHFNGHAHAYFATNVNDNAKDHLEWPMNHLSLSNSYRIPCRIEATRHGWTSRVLSRGL